jgi:hypothetical protein
MCSADGSTNVTRFHLVVNLKIAKTIGLTIPEPFLLRAAVLSKSSLFENRGSCSTKRERAEFLVHSNWLPSCRRQAQSQTVAQSHWLVGVCFHQMAVTRQTVKLGHYPDWAFPQFFISPIGTSEQF